MKKTTIERNLITEQEETYYNNLSPKENLISAIIITIFILLFLLKSLIFKIIVIGIGALLLTPIIFHYVIEIINKIFLL